MFRIRSLLMILLAFFAAASPAGAKLLRTGEALCFAVTPQQVPDAAVDRLTYRCSGHPRDYRQASLWLRTPIPQNAREWALMMHQTRFDRAVAYYRYTDGVIDRETIRRGDFGQRWRIGGQILFSPPLRDAALQAIYLRVDRLSSERLLRLRLKPADEAGSDLSLAAMLVGAGLVLLFLGTIYNLCLAVAIRRQFLAWHGAWACSVLVWGLVWSQLALIAFPGMAGTIAARTSTALSGIAIAMATFSAATAFAPAYLPRWLRSTLIVLGVAIFACCILAATEFGGNVDVYGPMLEVLTLSILGLVAVALAIAWGRGSREARDLASAWSVPMLALASTTVFNLEDRMFGGGPQLLVLFASALQTLWLSVATTIRLSRLRIERDEARASENEMGELARRDTLTGLLNRRGILECWQRFYLQPFRPDFGLGLLLIDVDHFKSVNDLFGHEVGDDVLSRIARMLKVYENNLRIAGRWGGEEFMIGIGAASREDILSLAEKLRADLAACRHGVVSDSRPVTVSVGGAFGTAGTSFGALFRAADGALYEAKQAGRNRVVFTDAGPGIDSLDLRWNSWDQARPVPETEV
ncbi:diguanylate cyclase [Sphingomonas sp. ID0503]|uniref:sensor domain-containing diguanylate cyclase n=1 Tax=Sphingomonas sp. ID0503 TaxID=3399691 RepID=UPI003AFB5984